MQASRRQVCGGSGDLQESQPLWRGKEQNRSHKNSNNPKTVRVFIHYNSVNYIIHFRLSAALAQTGFADAMKKLGLDSGAGSDGKLPTSRLTQLRNARFADGREIRADGEDRQTDGDGCKNVEAEWKVFNTSGTKAVPGVDSEPDAAETNKTIASLDRLNNG